MVRVCCRLPRCFRRPGRSLAPTKVWFKVATGPVDVPGRGAWSRSRAGLTSPLSLSGTRRCRGRCRRGCCVTGRPTGGRCSPRSLGRPGCPKGGLGRSRSIWESERARGPSMWLGRVGEPREPGNVATSWTSPTFSAVAGSVGLSLAFNSKAATTVGLTGSYFDDADGVVGSSDQPKLARRDGAGASTGQRGTVPSRVSARTMGLCAGPGHSTRRCRAPISSGRRPRCSRWFGVNGTLVLDRWFAETYGSPVYGTAVSLTVGVPVDIKVAVWDSGGPVRGRVKG